MQLPLLPLTTLSSLETWQLQLWSWPQLVLNIGSTLDDKTHVTLRESLPTNFTLGTHPSTQPAFALTPAVSLSHISTASGSAADSHMSSAVTQISSTVCSPTQHHHKPSFFKVGGSLSVTNGLWIAEYLFRKIAQNITHHSGESWSLSTCSPSSCSRAPQW
jgi:hypothetical protein